MARMKEDPMWFIPAFLSAAFSASAAVTEKKTLLREHPLLFSLLLSLFGVLLSLPFLALVRWSAVRPEAVLLLAGKALLGAGSFLCVMYALKHLEISSALPLLTLTPGVVAVGAFVLLGESLTPYEIAGLVLLLCGIYLLQLRQGQRILDPFRFMRLSRAYLFVFGAILIFSVTSILDKTLLSRYKLPPEFFLPFQNGCFAIYFGVFLFLANWRRRGKGEKLRLRDGLRRSWRGILLVALFTLVYRYSHILAVKAGPVALVLAVKRTSVFMATVAGGRYFRDEGLVRKSVATAVMVAGAILILLL